MTTPASSSTGAIATTTTTRNPLHRELLQQHKHNSLNFALLKQDSSRSLGSDSPRSVDDSPRDRKKFSKNEVKSWQDKGKFLTGYLKFLPEKLSVNDKLSLIETYANEDDENTTKNFLRLLMDQYVRVLNQFDENEFLALLKGTPFPLLLDLMENLKEEEYQKFSSAIHKHLQSVFAEFTVEQGKEIIGNLPNPTVRKRWVNMASNKAEIPILSPLIKADTIMCTILIGRFKEITSTLVAANFLNANIREIENLASIQYLFMKFQETKDLQQVNFSKFTISVLRNIPNAVFSIDELVRNILPVGDPSIRSLEVAAKNQYAKFLLNQMDNDPVENVLDVAKWFVDIETLKEISSLNKERQAKIIDCLSKTQNPIVLPPGTVRMISLEAILSSNDSHDDKLGSIAEDLRNNAVFLYKRLTPDDIYDFLSRKENSNISDITKSMDVIAYFVGTEILNRPNLEEAQKRILFFINLAHQCFKIHDNASASSIVAGLTLIGVIRLIEKWSAMPSKEHGYFTILKGTLSSDSLDRKVTPETALTVPMFNIYRKMLTFIYDGNPKHFGGKVNLTRYKLASDFMKKMKQEQSQLQINEATLLKRNTYAYIQSTQKMNDDAMWQKSLNLIPSKS